MSKLIRAADQIPDSDESEDLGHRLLWLPDEALTMGIHIQAGKGSGKSRLMGRLLAWLYFIKNVPFIIFDPHGPTIDNFLDKLTRMPRGIQERLGPRVLYVDMSGFYGYVTPFPLYYRLGNESLYKISQRYLDVVRKLDPNLKNASVEGWNPLWRTGTYTGMILAALGCQITDAEGLLRNPVAWEGRLRQVAAAHPDAKPAVDFFRELRETKENIRTRKTESFFNKIALFSLDPTTQAMFGSNIAGVDWADVQKRRLAVLLDFRHEHDIESRSFKMMWAFHYFLEFIKHRGAGRHLPIGLIIDELSSLFSTETVTGEVLSAEIDELINVISRNYRVWLTIAHQEQFQFSERIQKTLMGMGTQILGVTSDRGSALSSASRFYRYDPYLVKKYDPPSLGGSRSVEYTIDEQILLQSYQFADLGRFQFLVRPAAAEGDQRGKLHKISIARLDQGQYPDEELVAQARELLVKRTGKPVDEVLAEVHQRQAQKKSLPEPPTPPPSSEINEEEVPPLWTE